MRLESGIIQCNTVLCLFCYLLTSVPDLLLCLPCNAATTTLPVTFVVVPPTDADATAADPCGDADWLRHCCKWACFCNFNCNCCVVITSGFALILAVDVICCDVGATVEPRKIVLRSNQISDICMEADWQAKFRSFLINKI